MELYVLRHAVAVDRGTPGYEEDSERPLTPDGKERLKKVARSFSGLDVAPQVIVSSPYVRARQTAEIASRVIGFKQDLVFSDSLTPDSHPQTTWDFLVRHCPTAASVLLVGHEPHLSSFIFMALTGGVSAASDVPPAHPRLELKKAGLCKLSVENLGTRNPWVTLLWLLTPGQMRRL